MSLCSHTFRIWVALDVLALLLCTQFFAFTIILARSVLLPLSGSASIDAEEQYHSTIFLAER